MLSTKTESSIIFTMNDNPDAFPSKRQDLPFQGTLNLSQMFSFAEVDDLFNGINVRDRNRLLQPVELGVWPEHGRNTMSCHCNAPCESASSLLKGHTCTSSLAEAVNRLNVAVGLHAEIEACEMADDDAEQNKPLRKEANTRVCQVFLDKIDDKVCGVGVGNPQQSRKLLPGEIDDKQHGKEDEDTKHSRKLLPGDIDDKRCGMRDEDTKHSRKLLPGDIDDKRCGMRDEDTKHSRKLLPGDIDDKRCGMRDEDTKHSRKLLPGDIDDKRCGMRDEDTKHSRKLLPSDIDDKRCGMRDENTKHSRKLLPGDIDDKR